MARAEGDVKGEQQHAENLAKLENALRVSQNSLLKGAFTGAYGAAGKAYAADIAAKAKIKAASMRGAQEKKPTDLGSMIQIEFDALVANGADASDPNTKRIAAQNAARALSKSAGTTRADTDAIDRANTAFENKVLMDRNLRKLRTTDPVAYDLRLKEIRSEVEAQYKVRPDAAAPIGNDAAPAKPAAAKPTATKPAAGITPEQFNAQWAKLDPGQTLVGPDGKTYTKK